MTKNASLYRKGIKKKSLLLGRSYQLWGKQSLRSVGVCPSLLQGFWGADGSTSTIAESSMSSPVNAKLNADILVIVIYTEADA